MARSLSTLVVRTLVDNAELVKGLNEAGSAVDRTSQRMESRIGKLRATLGGVARVGGTMAAIAAAVARANVALGQLGDAAQTAGVSTQFFQEFGVAATAAGLSTDRFGSALTVFSDELGRAQTGTGRLKKILDLYGVSALNADGTARSLRDVLFDLADAAQATGNQQQQLQIATAAFGADGQRLAPILAQGSAGLRAFGEQAALTGSIIDGELIAQSQRMLKEWRTLVAFIKRELTTALATVGVSFFRAAQDSATGLEFFQQALVNLVAGPTDAINLSRVEEQIREARERINEISSQPGLAAGDRETRLARANTELARLEARANGLREALSTTGGEPTVGGVVPQIEDITKTDAAADARARFLESIDKEIEALEKEASGFRDLSRAEQIRFEAREAAEAGAREDQVARFNALADEIEANERLKASDEELLALGDELAKQQQDFIKGQQDIQAEREEIRQALLTDTELVQQEIARVNELFQNGAIEPELYAKAIEALNTEMLRLDDTAQNLGDAIGLAFEDAIVGGRSLSEILKGLEQDILRIITRQLVTEPLARGIGDAIAGFGLFGGGRQSGGFVDPGRAFLVGEAGPELFVPKRAGEIISNDRLAAAGGGAAPVVINIQNPIDVAAFQRSQGQIMARAQSAATRASRRNS